MIGHRTGASLAARRAQTGQAIVVMVVAIVVALAMVATIVDGGNVFAQQRVTQNGADATAEAGAVMLAERLAASLAARRRQTGQAIVIMVVAIVVALAMVGTIVDGGNVLAQQRVTQNGADATAEAGG